MRRLDKRDRQLHHFLCDGWRGPGIGVLLGAKASSELRISRSVDQSVNLPWNNDKEEFGETPQANKNYAA